LKSTLLAYIIKVSNVEGEMMMNCSTKSVEEMNELREVINGMDQQEKMQLLGFLVNWKPEIIEKALIRLDHIEE
jgi:hypothetical protein